jgi:hypothetical protein
MATRANLRTVPAGTEAQSDAGRKGPAKAGAKPASKADAVAEFQALLNGMVQPVARTKGKTPMAEVVGHEQEVSEYLKRCREIESFLSLNATVEETLKPVAADARQALEENSGTGIRSVVVKGEGEDFLRLTWKDAFTALDFALVEPLRAKFGDAFAVLFTVVDAVEGGPVEMLKDDADMAALRERLGDDYGKFFKTEIVGAAPAKLTFAKGAMDVRARLRSDEKADQALVAILDMMFKKYQHQPSFVPPK